MENKKRIIVTSKTHLDLGFTDYAAAVKKLYFDEYLPNAFSVAKKLNVDKNRFVWTTGSWIIKEALNTFEGEKKEALIEALQKGFLSPHALPFTLHTELLDEDTFEYGMSLIKKIDEISGRKTIAAKMTDVPGHTKAIVPLLAKNGIKMLHIGVNGASALPEVPECFLWKNDDCEIVVVYSGDYGGTFKSELINDELIIEHTVDNRGVKSAESVLKSFEKIEKANPNAEVTAGTLNEIAQSLWDKREKLPVVTSEIGDTWIHGAASDPYKAGAIRTLIELKNKWLKEGTLKKETSEYENLCDNILCLAEHTCAMDVKMYFADFENYLKKDFQKAREKDTVKMHHPLRDFPRNLEVLYSRLKGRYKKGSYRAVEKSWAEQREYITCAVNSLSAKHKKEALEELSLLRPEKAEENKGTAVLFGQEIALGKTKFAVNRFGSLSNLSIDGKEIIPENDKPALTYRVFTKEDYDYWFNNYTRNRKETAAWSVADFGRPLLKYAEGKYPSGERAYKAIGLFKTKDSVTVDFAIDNRFTEEAGAPRKAQIKYTETENGLHITLKWFEKDACRLTEMLYFSLYPRCKKGEITLHKLGSDIDPFDIVRSGNRNISASFGVDCGDIGIINHQSPLVCMGKGKILQFDNIYQNPEKDGISFILHDNVWGTNFPLWYEENARFDFDIVTKKLS